MGKCNDSSSKIPDKVSAKSIHQENPVRADENLQPQRPEHCPFAEAFAVRYAIQFNSMRIAEGVSSNFYLNSNSRIFLINRKSLML